MVPEASIDMSRRQFLAAGGLTVAAACFAPSDLIAQTGGLVQGAFKEAATAKVTIQNLRRNVSVLLGAGGNIAVLTGSDGKLLVDAAIITARPKPESRMSCGRSIVQLHAKADTLIHYRAVSLSVQQGVGKSFR